jgi:arsenical pump membrane protein
MTSVRAGRGPESDTNASDSFRSVMRAAAGVAAVAALAVRGAGLVHAAARTAAPFATVALVVALGYVGVRAGVFQRVSQWLLLDRWGDGVAVAVLLAWTATLAALVNLDVAVVVAMPLGLTLSERRGLDPSWTAIAVANTANATSILLPTSNVTNLLVMQSARTGGAAYFLAAWPAWAAVAGLTIAVMTSLVVRMRSPDTPAEVTPRWSLTALLADLAAMFLLASALRSLLPSGLQIGGSFPIKAGGDGMLAAVVNNLPAAAAIHPVTAAGRWAGVLGMAIGPNLFLTGSVATVICRRIAREGGADLDPLRFTLVGLALVPLQLAAGAVGLLASGALHHV